MLLTADSLKRFNITVFSKTDLLILTFAKVNEIGAFINTGVKFYANHYTNERLGFKRPLRSSR